MFAAFRKAALRYLSWWRQMCFFSRTFLRVRVPIVGWGRAAGWRTQAVGGRRLPRPGWEATGLDG